MGPYDGQPEVLMGKGFECGNGVRDGVLLERIAR